MSFLRMHWFDVGLALAALVGLFILVAHPSGLALLLWLSLITLFLHQAEEYRYPLNPQIALIVNVVVGWLFYILAAVFAEKAIWLGIAIILVSAGNFIAHTFLFNIKGKTRYNPGMLTADLLFLPLAVVFFILVIQNRAATPVDWLVGVMLGIALNVIGILKMIDWLKDKNTPYVFPQRFLPPALRKTK